MARFRGRSGGRPLSLALVATFALACGGGPAEPTGDDIEAGGETTVEVVRELPREPPPESGPRQDLAFPAIVRDQLRSGLEVNTVRTGQLPVVYLRLVVRSGDASDPDDLPGLAGLVADMLKEGTSNRSSAELAEDVEFLGARLSVGTDEENLYVMIRALAEHLPRAMTILADVVRRPAFDARELRRLVRREQDRLALRRSDPRWLARRVFYRELYGAHPYAHVDTTDEALGRVRSRHLERWHRDHVRPNNAFLVAVGDVDPTEVQELANRAFRGWQERRVEEPTYADPPARSERQVVVVNRPGSTQSVIYVGNLALARSNEDYVPLLVANQVLGGSASSRLFMDLRERRSLTYGAYSSIGERVQVAPFLAFAAVPNASTEAALEGFVEHLEQIVEEAPPPDELQAAQTFIADKFPLEIETAGRIAYMVEQLRSFGLPDDYWDTYRTSIRDVTADEAFAAARAYIHPAEALVVAVGEASEIVEPLRRYGPVRVEDTDGEVIETFEAAPAD
ncbi:MAG: M16 family metallopeptidase [Sandaracinaceae bacterium]